MTLAKHTLKRFDTDLEAISARVLEMGGLAEMQVNQALNALFAEDVFLARQVIDQDQQLDRLEMEIDRMCCTTIARHHPTANDLKLVLSSAKSIVHLERIGDEAKKIAHMAERLSTHNCLAVQNFSQIRHSAGLAQKMLCDVLDSFARLDSCAARNVMNSDSLANEESLCMLRILIGLMTDNPQAISASLEILLVAKALERIRDHIKTISELVIDASNRHAEMTIKAAH